jgi:hypothetical protein
MILGCFVAGFSALRSFAAADDLHGVLYSGVTLASGLSAVRLFGADGGDE